MTLRPGLIFEIATQAGLDVPEHGAKRRIHCPFHEDHHPSAFVSEDNVFYCSVCTPDRGWAAKKFAEALNVSWPVRGAARPPPARESSPKRKSSLFSPADAQLVWRAARARSRDDDAVEEDRDVYSYLYARGLAESWEDQGFGVLAPAKDLPMEVAWWPECGYRVIAPLYDQNGSLASIQARSVTPAADPKVLFPEGSRVKGCAFANASGLELLRGRVATDRPVVLGEGLTDYLALGIVVAGPLLAAPGAGMLASLIGAWARGRELCLAIDLDVAADRAMEAVARAAKKAGAIRLRRIRWPEDCLDACNVTERHGVVALSEFIDEHVEKGKVDERVA